MRADDGSARLRCEYCGEEARLGGDVLAAGHDYRRGVSAEAARAEEQALVARQYASLSGGEVAGRAPLVGPVSGVACRSCGAPTSFEVGAMIAHCGHCGASLLATDETRARGLSEAARAVRAARLAALKSERFFATGLGKKYRFLAVYPAVAVIAVPAIAALLMARSTTEPDAELKALGFAGFSLLGAAIVAGVTVWRRSHRERAMAAVRHVIARYRGYDARGVEAMGAWLNEHWCDAYDVYDLSASFDAPAAACVVDGFPALVIVHPLRSAGTPFIEILVSVWYEGRSESGQGPATRGDADARRFVGAQGFSLKNGPSGIVASLRGDDCRKRLKAGIDFDGTLTALARIATSQGGRSGVT